MIQIKWKSFTDYDLTLEIDDGDNTVTAMTPSATPFVTEIDDDDDMFTPIRYQTGMIGIVGTLSQMEQLVGNYPFERPVTLKVSKNGTSLGVMWKGYVQSATFSQSWIGGNQELSIPVVSQIGLWADIQQPFTDSFMSFAGIIKAAGDAVGGFDGYVFPQLIDPATTLAYKVLMRNFCHRDERVKEYNVYIGDTYDLVIAEVCKLFGLTCIEHKGMLCFIAPDYTGNYVMYNNVNMELIDDGQSPSNPTTYTSTTYTEDIRSTDNSLSFLSGKRKVSVAGKVNPFILTPLEVDGNEIPLGDTMAELWNYGNQPDCYYTKCFRTDQYAFMDVMGVGFENEGHIAIPTANMNVRYENFCRQKAGNIDSYYGCSFVCERQYYGPTRDDSVGKDTGWNFKTLFRMKNTMIPTTHTQLLDPIVIYKTREREAYSYLWCFTDTDQSIKGAKYLSINGTVKKCGGTTLQHDWENVTGYFYMKVYWGINQVYEGYLRAYDGSFNGGTIANQYGSYGVAQKGFVVQLDNSLITDKNAAIIIAIYAINYQNISGGVEADMYYSIENFNVTIENRWSELDAEMNENEQNESEGDTNHGWSDDYDVTCEMTTSPDFASRKLSAQFGKGIVLANDVMTENPHVLYSNKSADLALKDRLIAHYADSKKKLQATVGMLTAYGPLEPWQTHSPASHGNWAVLSQSIRWRDDTIQGQFYER